jgi:hypothetical protein
MLAMVAYVIAAASALAAAAFGLFVLLGGSAQLGKEAAIAADKALHTPGMQRGNDVGAAAKTTGTATEAKPAQATQKQKSAKTAASKRKKKGARTTRGARRN